MLKFTGLEYLYIDIANQAGHDKETWQKRIQWTKDNLDKLEGMDHGVMFKKAVNALRMTQRGEETGFVMSLDATASGYQIMAILAGCKKTASAVNLINTGVREDLYSYVANAMNLIKGVQVSRDDCKPPVMVVAYGSKKAPEHLFGSDTPELKAFWEIMFKELPGAMWLMQLMQAHWDNEAYFYIWTMPDDHVVKADVLQTMETKIEIDELDHTTFNYRYTDNVPKEGGLSLAANIVHSIDAYIVREMIRRGKKVDIVILPIHDCFYAHPNNMQFVREVYVEILAEISKMDLLGSILSDITGTDIELRKDSDITQDILKAEYALS